MEKLPNLARCVWTYVFCFMQSTHLPIAKHFRLSTRDSLYSRDPFAFALFNSGCNFPSDRSPLIFLNCASSRLACSPTTTTNELRGVRRNSDNSWPRDSVALVYVRGTNGEIISVNVTYVPRYVNNTATTLRDDKSQTSTLSVNVTVNILTVKDTKWWRGLMDVRSNARREIKKSRWFT